MDMTLRQIATRLHISLEKARLLLLAGKFPNAYKLDPSKRTSPYRIPQTDLKKFLMHRHTA